jgi:CRISPR-associated endonuclease Csn1
MYNEIKNSYYNEKLPLLEKYLVNQKPFETKQIEEKLASIIISFKVNKTATRLAKRKIIQNGKKIIIQKNIIVPKGPLSEESVYGKIKRLVIENIKLSPSFIDADKIIDPHVKKVILERLKNYDNDPAKAFANFKKDPIYLDELIQTPITTVSLRDYVDEYVIKYPLATFFSPKDNEKQIQNKLDSIVDMGVRRAIEKRLHEKNFKVKEAFSDLVNNPVWINKEKRIEIKSFRCFTGLKIVVPIMTHDDVQNISYEKYVKPGKNHHIAIYESEDGKLIEHVVSFWDAVERARFAVPIIIKNPKEVWDIMLEKEMNNNDFLSKLPGDKWKYKTSLLQNELFVFNMQNEELADLLNKNEYEKISKNIYRVRKLTSNHYWFNHQYETSPRESIEDKKAERCIQKSVNSMNGIKVKVNTLGKIYQIHD